MQLYTVIPIAKGVGKEILHYYGAPGVKPGALVSMPLRNKVARGIVIAAEDVRDAKADLKSASFALKRIKKVESESFLPREYIAAAFETGRYFAASTGSVLTSLIPAHVLSAQGKLPHGVSHSQPKEVRRGSFLVQADDEERYSHYKGFIRGEFAKRHSVYFCLPTAEDIKEARAALEKGIEQYTVSLHSGLSDKEFAKAVETIREARHPVLIVGTVPYLAVAREDTGAIIIDRENSRSYRTIARPYLDMRVFARMLAKERGIATLMGDIMLSAETLWRYKNDEHVELSPLKMRILSPAENQLVDMKRGDEQGFKIISDELAELVRSAKGANERTFIFCGRKGLAPSVVCGDCGRVVRCRSCRSPITLYERADTRVFFCNKCGAERDAMERCEHCDSWKLETLGIGTDSVAAEIKALAPESTVFIIDKEHVRTEKRALEIMRSFHSQPGSVLIGTELALHYLKERVENVAVASMDALFSVPDYRVNERCLYLLLVMRSRAEKRFLVQTRNAADPLFEAALKGNIGDFYRAEIADRKSFSYPPFCLFIKVTAEGRGAALEEAVKSAAERLSEWNPRVYESVTPGIRGATRVHILLKVDPGAWPEEKLLQTLRSLSPAFSIKVDPESLL